MELRMEKRALMKALNDAGALLDEKVTPFVKIEFVAEDSALIDLVTKDIRVIKVLDRVENTYQAEGNELFLEVDKLKVILREADLDDHIVINTTIRKMVVADVFCRKNVGGGEYGTGKPIGSLVSDDTQPAWGVPKPSGGTPILTMTGSDIHQAARFTQLCVQSRVFVSAYSEFLIDIRPDGVYWVSTDSVRLARARVNAEVLETNPKIAGKRALLVPGEMCEAILRTIRVGPAAKLVTISVDEQQALTIFEQYGRTLVGRDPEKTFPNWRHLWPQRRPLWITFKPSEWLPKLKGMVQHTKDTSTQAEFRLYTKGDDATTIRLRGYSQWVDKGARDRQFNLKTGFESQLEAVSVELEEGKERKEMSFWFNLPYVIDFLEVAVKMIPHHGLVRWGIESYHTPSILEVNENFQQILMPISK